MALLSLHGAVLTETFLTSVLTSFRLHLMGVWPKVTPRRTIMMLSGLFIYSSLFQMVKMINAATFTAVTSAFWGLSLKDIPLKKMLINLISPPQAMQMMTLLDPVNTYFINVKICWKRLRNFTGCGNNPQQEKKNKIKATTVSSSGVKHDTAGEWGCTV